jgi:diguanylate cyclase (GGDEF)-like protein/PAS domain S-box-containing protein
MSEDYFVHCELRSGPCQSRFSHIIEKSVNGIVVFDDNGSVRFVNQAAETLLGRPAVELLGKPGDFIQAMADAGEWVVAREDGGSIAAEIQMVATDWDGETGSLAFLRDITDRKRSEDALKAAIARLEAEKSKCEAIVAAIGDGISIHDTGFRILYQNDIHKKMMGEHLGEFCYQAYAGREHSCEDCHMKISFTDGEIHTVERQVVTDQGKMYFEITVSPLKDPQGKVIAGIEVVRDITERKRTEDRLKYMSSHDILTGLYNRFYFEQELDRLERSRHFPLSVVMADLDDLKIINDTRGHAAGDEMLTIAALLFKEAFRGEDVVARVGGDEFAVLLPDTDDKAVKEILGRIRDSLRTWNETHRDPVNLSLGIDTAHSGGELLDALKRADQRMYQDKLSRTGRPPRRLP